MSRRRYADLGCLLGMAIFLIMFFLPAPSKPRAKATQQQCKCNLQQLTLATMAYSEDNDQRLPNI
ncbi:MAG: hypothetical protein ABFE07_26360 [Armatimonadia bacterium]